MRFRGVAWPPGERLRAIITKEVYTHYPRKTCVPISRLPRSYWTRVFFHLMLLHALMSYTPPLHTAFTHTKTHTLYSTFIGLTTDKLSLKHIFFHNITSCSVQLREVIITLGDVAELSASTIWIFWSTTPHPSNCTSARCQRYSNEFQPSVWWRSLTLHWGCYGWVNFLLCCLGRQTLSSLFFLHSVVHMVDVFYPSCLHCAVSACIFSIGGPASNQTHSLGSGCVTLCPSNCTGVAMPDKRKAKYTEMRMRLQRQISEVNSN